MTRITDKPVTETQARKRAAEYHIDARGFDALTSARHGWETAPDRRTRYTFTSIAHMGAAMPDTDQAGADDIWRAARPVGPGRHLCELDYPTARRIANQGGRGHTNQATDSLARQLATLRATIRPTGQRMTMAPAVAGGVPCIPRALGGTPKAMLRPTKKKAPQPVVRLGFHVGRNAMVSENTVFARAAALLALVEDFEQSGQRVELVAVWRNSDTPYSTTQGMDWDVTIKRPGDYYTLDSVAFALDPAFQRRCAWTFAMLEKVLFNAPIAKFLQCLGQADSKQAQGFDYFAPRLEYDKESAKEWYASLREQWGLAK